MMSPEKAKIVLEIVKNCIVVDLMKKKAKGDHSDDSLDGDIIEALDVALTLLDNQIELEAKDE